MGHARMPSPLPSVGKEACGAIPLRPSSSMATSSAKQHADTAQAASEAAARGATFRAAPAALLPAATSPSPAAALSLNDASASKTHKSDFIPDILKTDALVVLTSSATASGAAAPAQHKNRTDGVHTTKVKTSDDAIALTSFFSDQQQKDLECQTGGDDVLFLRVAGTSNFERACRDVNADGQTVKIVRNPEAKDAERSLRCPALHAPVCLPPGDSDTWSHTQSCSRDDSERVELCTQQGQGQQDHRLRLQNKGLLCLDLRCLSVWRNMMTPRCCLFRAGYSSFAAHRQAAH